LEPLEPMNILILCLLVRGSQSIHAEYPGAS
jgi:hypothetical protein